MISVSLLCFDLVHLWFGLLSCFIYLFIYLFSPSCVYGVLSCVLHCLVVFYGVLSCVLHCLVVFMVCLVVFCIA